MNSLFHEDIGVKAVHKFVPNTIKVRYEQPSSGAARLFLFDYDGTLTPIISNPDLALPSELALKTLTKLTEAENNVVWIISGRDQAFLEKQWGHIKGLGLSAEHGCFVREPNSSKWKTLVSQTELDKWQNIVISLFHEYDGLCPGAHTEIKRSALTWHYRRANDYDAAFEKAKELNTKLHEALTGLDVEIMEGKANIEVRPKSVSKGDIVRQIVQQHGPNGGVDFVVCCGDDRTDEDMFNALSHLSAPSTPADGTGIPHMSREDVFSIHVGPAAAKTDARFYIDSPAELVDAIATLV